MISSTRDDEKHNTSDNQEIKTTADISLVKFENKSRKTEDEALVPLLSTVIVVEEKPSPLGNLDKLPDDVLQHVFSFFKPLDMSTLHQVRKSFRNDVEEYLPQGISQKYVIIQKARRLADAYASSTSVTHAGPVSDWEIEALQRIKLEARTLLIQGNRLFSSYKVKINSIKDKYALLACIVIYFL